MMRSTMEEDNNSNSKSNNNESKSNSMEIALSDGVVVSCIIAHLKDPRDLHSACQVSRMWDDVVSWTNQRLTVKSRKLIPNLVLRFKNIKHLNMAHCCDELEDFDLFLVCDNLRNLKVLTLGSCEEPQNRISNEGFVEFVRNLEMLEEVALSSTCSVEDSGIEALVRVCPRLRVLSLENCRGLSDASLDHLRHCRNLQELSLKGTFRFSSAGLGKIGESCPGIVRFCLDVDYLDVGCALSSIAQRCSSLRELRLRFSHGDLSNLAGMSCLFSLYIDTDQYVNSLAEIVASNRHLREFAFFNRRCPLSDAELIRIVETCRNLQKLCVVASQLTDMALVWVMELKGLICLGLGHFKSEGQGLVAIGLCGIGLREISLRYAKRIRDVELETMIYSNSAQLERIDLKGCLGPSSRGFSTIALCRNLGILDLSFTSIDDVGLAAIASGCEKLSQLSLVKCNNVCDMKVLSKFRCLEDLNVDQCDFVSDEGLDCVALKCRKLMHVSLASTRVSDVGLSYLTACKMLRTLRVPYCPAIQGPGLVALASLCDWIQYFVISHRFTDTTFLEELRKKHCMVKLEVDEMALVPFGIYMQMV